MATFKSEFQELADELINGEFADFLVPLRICKDGGGYNPNTGTSSPAEDYAMQAIPTDLTNAERIFANATNDSVYLIAYKADTHPSSLDSSYSAYLDGKKMAIQAVENDPANAVWLFRLAR